MCDPPTCSIDPIVVGSHAPVLIAGPCVAESLELCLQVARDLREVCAALDVPFVFKASYDKANRTRADSYRGPGLTTGLEWLAEVRRDVGVPVLSDVHAPAQVGPASDVLDCLQIPAFLCRQTDLLIEAGRSGKPVNIKKGQFMAPQDMAHAVDKVRHGARAGAERRGDAQVMITERGTSFGYNRLVTDFRAIVQMRQFAPVVFDATHSVQEPGGLGGASGGQRQFAPLLAQAAMAVGADALFVETHPQPDSALSDAACMVPLDRMRPMLQRCLAVAQAARLDVGNVGGENA
ncbi:MAG: 3-deoxy-8-phosphooctulonate synthase [Phycisphaerae bacterium]|nr:3-deoxy-8-phosphooctulonate synthase [Phycisphaerae bacterium]